MRKKQTGGASITAPANTQKISKIQLVKNWLLSGKSITHRQSSKMYGYDRLADGIWKLRNPPHNMNIATIPTTGQDRFLNAVEFATYKWQGEKPKIVYEGTLKDDTKVFSFVHRYPMKPYQIAKHIRDYVTNKLREQIKTIRVTKLKKNWPERHRTHEGRVKTKTNDFVFRIFCKP